MLHSSVRPARLLHVDTRNVGDGTERPGPKLTSDPGNEKICADRAEKTGRQVPRFQAATKLLFLSPYQL